MLRILTGKKHHQIKLQRLQKVQIWTFELVTGKTLLFVIGPFVLTILFVLTLAPDMAHSVH